MSQSDITTGREKTEEQRDKLTLLTDLAAKIIDFEDLDMDGDHVVRATVEGSHGRHFQVDVFPDGYLDWRVAR